MRVQQRPSETSGPKAHGEAEGALLTWSARRSLKYSLNVACSCARGGCQSGGAESIWLAAEGEKRLQRGSLRAQSRHPTYQEVAQRWHRWPTEVSPSFKAWLGKEPQQPVKELEKVLPQVGG